MIRRLASQFLRYASVGAVATVGHYSTLILLVEKFAVDPVVGSMSGFVVGGIMSYLLNRRFTFATDRSHLGAIPRFAVTALVAFALTGLLMAWFTDGLGLHYLVAQVITTGLVMIWTFSANRFWTFGDARAV